MVILHIAALTENKYNGVCVVVPKHVIEQGRDNSVALLNIKNVWINELFEQQLSKKKTIDIAKLKSPFNAPDIVVFHEPYEVKFLKIAKQLNRLKIPYIIVPHCELTKEAQKKKWLKKKAANLLLFNKFINGAFAIQCLSQKELETTNFGKNKFIGTNGVDMPKIRKNDFNENKINFTYRY